MPTVTFNVTAANLTLLKNALAHHQGKDVADVTNADVKAWGLIQYRGLVQKYREHKRNTDNPVDDSEVLT